MPPRVNKKFIPKETHAAAKMRILQPVPFKTSNCMPRTVLARGNPVLGCPFAAELFNIVFNERLLFIYN